METSILLDINSLHNLGFNLEFDDFLIFNICEFVNIFI